MIMKFLHFVENEADLHKENHPQPRLEDLAYVRDDKGTLSHCLHARMRMSLLMRAFVQGVPHLQAVFFAL